MKNIRIYSLLFLLLVSIVNSQNGNFTRHTYIIPTESTSVSSSSVQCPKDNSNANMIRCLTLNELIDSPLGEHGTFQSREEVIFLSGTHVVDGTKRDHVFSRESSNLVLRGESNKVTIVCLKWFAFVSGEGRYVKVSNLTFINCTMNSSQPITYEGFSYCCYYTLLYIALEGRMIIENVEITSKSKVSIAVYVKGHGFSFFADVQLAFTNLKSSSGVSIGPFDPYGARRTVISIENSSFNESYVEIVLFGSFYNCEVNVTVKNVSFKNYNGTTWSSLIFRGNTCPFVVKMEEVVVSKSISPYVIYANQTKVIFVGKNKFHCNHGAVYLVHSELYFFNSTVEFINNTVAKGKAAPLVVNSSTVVFRDSYVIFKANYGFISGGLIGTSGSILRFQDSSTVHFERNEGKEGGALSLNKESILRFNTSVPELMIRISFISNEAQTGGAIFVKDEDYISTNDRRLRPSVFNEQVTESNVTLTFSNNLAQIGGNQIYGGWIDWFVGEDGVARYNPKMSKILEFKDDTDVSSDPTRVCMCVNKVPNCSITEHQKDIYGQAFSLDLVAVGQRSGTVISFVEAKMKLKDDSQGEMPGEISKVQIVQRDCTTLRYTMTSDHSEETVLISPIKKGNFPKFDDKYFQEYPNDAILFQQFSVNLTIKKCPIGFTLHKTDRYCECQPSILKHGLNCDMDNHRIRRSESQWVGVTTIHTIAGKNPGIITHQHCPFDYCRRDSESLSIRLEEQDDQCAFDRAGILCGGCKAGLSVILGSSKCKRCTKHLVALLIPSLLIVGLLLVIFLMILNLTISVGTINGLIFYVNIIRAQHAVFFTPDISNSFLSKFIAWLNLDQGIESCFYNGLDAYINTWLQFLFPLYIWLIAAALIVSSHYSTRVSKLIGNNAVQVLATLFLISYAKMLRLIIDVFSFTTITYPDGYKKTVWLIDGNVEFFKGKHIPLVLVTVIFILLSLPYTFILLTIQFLYKISHYRIMFWVQRLKPFFDAYTGPYRANHRYWTGLLLTARIALLITFSVNQQNNISINLLAIITVSILLLGWLSSAHLVYESALNNILEIFFLCNITITSVAIFFNLYNQRNSPVAIYLSTSVTLVTLVAIILHHALRQLQLTKFGSKLKVKLLYTLPPFLKRYVAPQTDLDGEFSVAEMRQPSQSGSSADLIPQATPQGGYKSYNSYELKEPLLENQQA